MIKSCKADKIGILVTNENEHMWNYCPICGKPLEFGDEKEFNDLIVSDYDDEDSEEDT